MAETATKKTVSTPRTRESVRRGEMIKSDVPYPEDVDKELFGPAAYGTELVGGVQEHGDDQEFLLDYAKLETLPFEAPGRKLPKKRLYTVKAIHKDGRLVQLPFEPQINNTAASDISDAVGLRRYAQKGIRLLWDFNTMMPVYCAAWDCWAQNVFEGFCSKMHAVHTLPNHYKNADSIQQGLLEQNVTTSRVWGT